MSGVYFMSTVCGRPQGGRGIRPMWTHVDRERGVKNVIFCGRHKCMAPYHYQTYRIPLTNEDRTLQAILSRFYSCATTRPPSPRNATVDPPLSPRFYLPGF